MYFRNEQLISHKHFPIHRHIYMKGGSIYIELPEKQKEIEDRGKI